MWELVVITVGKLADQGFRQSAERYAAMVGGEWKVKLDWVPAGKSRDVGARVKEEGDALLRRVPKGGTVIALDPGGEAMDSPAFGRMLGSLKDAGRKPAFLVGGAHGLHRGVLEAAHRKVSLSTMTLPHELATVVLLEQIFRAGALYSGKPYAK
jgi:23S rRNA (pseudouridine1915-N3)-methyltransferase